MTRKRVLYGSLSLVAAIIMGGAIYLNTLLPIITGYAAKNLCSAVFVALRDPQSVEAVDLNFSFIRYTKNSVNYEEESVVSRFLWHKSKAVFRDGFGVTLLNEVSEEQLRQVKYPAMIDPDYSQDTISWPLGDIIPDTATGINKAVLQQITNSLITDSGGYNGNAFAFMVLHRGIPVVEAYKPQFNKNTRFLSWSMAKSITNAMVGILVREKKLDINQKTGIKEWEGSDRSDITLNHLMQMQSGLKWNEDYGNRSSVNVMLHCEGDMGRYAFDQQLEYPVGTHWYYSSGTSNIISYLIRRKFSNDSLYYKFVHNELFNKTGMVNAIAEVDPSGTIVGSSYVYATARDYARFGLLYLNDGVFAGERILPKGWVGYTASPAPESNGEYGSLFWLNRSKKLPSAPEDMYMCVGHDGQRIFILPSQELVLVVLGYSPSSNGGMDFDRLIKDILSAI